jgi:hypothetical protein
VKGIVFNLLESMAHEAGCSNEAWELVAEFAAAEVLLDGANSPLGPATDVQPANLFEVPAEAMLKCFARDSEAPAESSLDLIDLEEQWTGLDLSSVAPNYYDALPRQPREGFSSSAFADMDASLEADGWGEPSDDPGEPRSRRELWLLPLPRKP